MKATRPNGRSGKNGTYNPKHNDRQFDIGNSEHIDPDRDITPKEKSLIRKTLSAVKKRIQSAAKNIIQKLTARLQEPEIRTANTKQIKEVEKESLLARLRQARLQVESSAGSPPDKKKKQKNRTGNYS